MTIEGSVDAGPFSSWLVSIGAALRGEQSSDVPCGECTACCTSSQFVHISPDEGDTLACIPRELLFPAPKFPDGHVLMGYDERGHCPMLVDNRCSIYEHRPRTCRTYDCRVFAASGVESHDPDKEMITHQIRRWKFHFPTDEDRVAYEAVQSAARYLESEQEATGDAPTDSPTERSLLAIELHELFVDVNPETGRVSVTDPDPVAVRVELRRRAG